MEKTEFTTSCCQIPYPKAQYISEVKEHNTDQGVHSYFLICPLCQKTFPTSQLPEAVTPKAKDEYEICQICKKQCKGTDNYLLTTCSHTFHENCLIEKISRANKKCPVKDCRSPIPADTFNAILEKKDQGKKSKEKEIKINKANYSEDYCFICSKKYERNRETYCLLCDHKFHKDCLQEYVYKNGGCPICQVVFGDQVDLIFADEETKGNPEKEKNPDPPIAQQTKGITDPNSPSLPQNQIPCPLCSAYNPISLKFECSHTMCKNCVGQTNNTFQVANFIQFALCSLCKENRRISK